MSEGQKLILRNYFFFFAYLAIWIGSLCALAMSYKSLPRWLVILLVVILGILAPGLSDIKYVIQRMRHRSQNPR